MAYITFNFVVGSIGNALNALLGVQAFISHFPGGPAAFVANIDTLVVTQASFIVYTINTWSQDGLLLYRFYIIFGENLKTIIAPLCCYLAAVVCSCFLMNRLTTPGDFSRAEETLRFGIVFWSISIGTTIFLTLLIVLRLVILKVKERKAMVDYNNAPYLSVSATLMESAFLYSVVGGIYVVLYAKGSLTQYLVLALLGQATSISPLLITWRVAQQRAWAADTLQFSTKETFVFRKTGEQSELKTSGTAEISSTDVQLIDTRNETSPRLNIFPPGP